MMMMMMVIITIILEGDYRHFHRHHPQHRHHCQKHRFLLDGADSGNERVAEAIGLTRTSTPRAKQITFSDTITKVFPKIRREIIREPLLKSIDEIDEDNFDDSSDDVVVGGLKDGHEPIDLDFFCSGEKNKNYLKMQQKVSVY